MAIVLLSFTALAVDMSNARQVRRQAQGSADAAALAGAQDLPDPNAVVATVKEYALQNYGTPMSDWVGCVDPDALVELPDNGNTNTCISLGRTPGACSGASTRPAGRHLLRRGDRLRHHRRRCQRRGGGRPGPVTTGSSPPRWLQARGPATSASRTGATTATARVRSSGNFGSFDSRRTNIYFPTSSVQPDSLRINYSMGVDHVLSIYGTGDTKVCDVQTEEPVFDHEHRLHRRRQPPDPLHGQRGSAAHRRA